MTGPRDWEKAPAPRHLSYLFDFIHNLIMIGSCVSQRHDKQFSFIGLISGDKWGWERLLTWPEIFLTSEFQRLSHKLIQFIGWTNDNGQNEREFVAFSLESGYLLYKIIKWSHTWRKIKQSALWSGWDDFVTLSLQRLQPSSTINPQVTCGWWFCL